MGHESQARAFLSALRSGRLHHAWLLAGPRGIGKRTFADAAALRVLAGGDGPLDVSPVHPAARLVAAGSHLDRRVLEREADDKGKLRAGITVEQVRRLQALFQGTPALGSWRVVIVDAVDDLNRAAANALLKNLEEPPSGTLFLLVSHAPGRLLPTIRSRCRLLRFEPLSDVAVAAVLVQVLSDADAAERDALVATADGAPGRAVRFAGLRIDELEAAFVGLERSPRGERDRLALQLSRSLAAKPAAARYEAFLELVPAHLARAARSRAGPALGKAVALWERAQGLAASAAGLSLDPQAVSFELARLVASLDDDGPA